MTNCFNDICSEFYEQLDYYQGTSREDFLNLCVEERLNFLITCNSKVLDNTLNQLEHYIDDLITDTIPYVRCNNYKQKQKNSVKQNINYITRLFKKYNKSCICSTRMLKNLMKCGGSV